MKQHQDRELDNETQPLPDLPSTDEQAEEIAGGQSFPSYPAFNGGVFVG